MPLFHFFGRVGYMVPKNAKSSGHFPLLCSCWVYTKNVKSKGLFFHYFGRIGHMLNM